MMRKLAIRIVLWLCDHYDIVLLDEMRRSLTDDEVSRAQRWETFAKEAGGLFDMIDGQRHAAFEAYADCRPDDVAEKEYLAQQDRCWRQIKARVDSVVATGKIAELPNPAQLKPFQKSV